MVPRTPCLLSLAAFLGAAAIVACTSPQVGTNDGADNEVKTDSDTEKATPTPTSDPPAVAPPTDAGPAVEAGPGSVCVGTSTCITAREVGEVDGDGSGSSKTETGTGSEWLAIKVKEESNSSKDVGLRARLTVPAGSAMELHVYAKDCTTVIGQASGNPINEVATKWNDKFGSDDSKTILVEVRNVAADCSVNNTWSLELAGGTD